MYKSIVFLFLSFVVFFQRSSFASLTVIDESGQMGMLAGLALACNENTKKLSDYELIASRIIANKSLNSDQEKMGYRRFAEEKFYSYKKYKNSSNLDCKEILTKFEKIPLFKSTVYQNGDVKMFDGTLLRSKNK